VVDTENEPGQTIP